MWGEGPLLLDFPGKEPPHKEFLGWDPNWGIFGVFLYVYVLFSLLIYVIPWARPSYLKTKIPVTSQIAEIHYLKYCWDPDCLVQGPNFWISPKIDKGRSNHRPLNGPF